MSDEIDIKEINNLQNKILENINSTLEVLDNFSNVGRLAVNLI